VGGTEKAVTRAKIANPDGKFILLNRNLGVELDAFPDQGREPGRVLAISRQKSVLCERGPSHLAFSYLVEAQIASQALFSGVTQAMTLLSYVLTHEPKGDLQITNFSGTPSICERLREMGLHKGQTIRLLGRAPLRGPLLIQFGMSFLALRSEEAQCTLIQVL
jgi:Fe2+ transport system protein FeoA